MQQKFIGNTVHSAIRKAVARNYSSNDTAFNPNVENKTYRRVSAHALPLAWGPWTAFWTQMGVLGSDRDHHVSQIQLSFHAISNWQSTFDVEVKGGDQFIRTLGPGSATVTVTGNVATTLSVRYRSHSSLLTIATSIIS